MTHKVTANCTANVNAEADDRAEMCTHFSAYRLHADDPLIFHEGMVETWRNGDPSGCVMRYGGGEQGGQGLVPGSVETESLLMGTAGLNVTSLALLYEWEAPVLGGE
jgi:hypothetical protein